VSDARDHSARRTNPPLLIILARGEKVRHIRLRPLAAYSLAAVLAVGTVAHIGSATYLALRDGLLTTAAAPSIYAFEDRIASLRAQITEIGTEAAMEQRDVHRKVTELIEKQELLAQRQDRLEPLLGRSGRVEPPAAAKPSPPTPTPRPDRLQIRTSDARSQPVSASAYAPSSRLDIPWPLQPDTQELRLGPPDQPEMPDAGKDPSLEHSLLEVENRQLAQIETLTNQVYLTTETIEDVLELAGVTRKNTLSEGGPFVEFTETAGFNDRLRELDEALDRLDEVKLLVQRIPIINPLPGAKITSRFGSRKDPFRHQVAYHAGLDFRARKGDLIRATSAGRVIKAGWYGGYGRMVEVDHGGGLTTRYAHLHEILVDVGDSVVTAAPIARAGNSGRSTGAHLHYEVRRNGEALNPLKFIQAGRQLAKLL